MHDHHGNTVGLAAGALLLVGSIITAGIALYKAANKKTENVKENPQFDKNV